MKIQEAIEIISQNNFKWARPIKWKNSGTAISIKEHHLLIVPSAKGGTPWWATPTEITDNWEVLDPHTVLAELHE
jgi:hypothetical protein